MADRLSCLRCLHYIESPALSQRDAGYAAAIVNMLPVSRPWTSRGWLRNNRPITLGPAFAARPAFGWLQRAF
jgi:hypothetical protein